VNYRFNFSNLHRKGTPLDLQAKHQVGKDTKMDDSVCIDSEKLAFH
jgi:hypothetical protein